MPDKGHFPRIQPLTRAAAARLLTGASPALKRLLARFDRLFRLRSPFAPGLACIAGTIPLNAPEREAFGMPVLSATGNGLEARAALISCLGEAAEYLSSVEAPGDISFSIFAGLISEGWIHKAEKRAREPIDFVPAVEPVSGQRSALPADFCLRRAKKLRVLEPVGALSSGVAAGPDFAFAAERAILELVERDAAALWQFGGRIPRRAGRKAQSAAKAVLAKLRQGNAARLTRLLDLTSDACIPVIAAWSMDRSGAGLACGIAARRTPEAAAEAAVLELAQMEMAAALSLMKLEERGEAALSDADRRHLVRQKIRPLEQSLFQAGAVGRPRLIRPEAELALSLAARGIRIYLVDLTRAGIGISAARAVSPELQPFSGDAVTARLRALTKKRRPAAAINIY